MTQLLQNKMLGMFGIVFLFAFLITAEAAEGKISCPNNEVKDISFMQWDAKDTLSLELLGNDCTKAIVVLVIRDEQGVPRFLDAWPLWNLSAVNLKENGLVERVFGGLQNLGVFNSSKVPEHDSECFTEEFCYFGKSIGSEKHDAVKAAGVPILCIPVHYENTHCYYYDEKFKSSRILYGYGV